MLYTFLTRSCVLLRVLSNNICFNSLSNDAFFTLTCRVLLLLLVNFRLNMRLTNIIFISEFVGLDLFLIFACV